ncbi:MAG: hypothetical protein SGILL_007438 [Bacillariaceae sp.]
MSDFSYLSEAMGLEDPALAVGVIVAVLVVTATITYKLFSRQDPSTLPPLAPGGILCALRNMTSDGQPEFLRQCAKDTGSYTFRLSLPIPGTPMYVATGDSALARGVLTDPKTNKPKTYEEFEPVAPSIFTRNGSFWHVRRKGHAPAFSVNHVKRMNQVALECTDQWIKEKLIPWTKQGKSFDVAEEMISITLSAICKTAFEYDISEQEKKDFTRNSGDVFKEYFQRSMANPFRKFCGRLLPGRRTAIKAAASNQAFAMKILNKYRANPNPTKGTVIDLIANASYYRSDLERGADIITYLVAGHDTTAYTMAFTLLELARNPDEQRKVQQDLAAKATEEEWSKSQALQMVIKESMRLHPVSTNGSNRQVRRDFTTKEGWIIPKDSIVLASIGLLHHNSTVFEKPDKFLPSRWANPTKEMKDAFLIFSAGKQNCIGQSLANAELNCILPKILSEVELEVTEEGTTAFFLTLKPVGAMLKPKLRA